MKKKPKLKLKNKKSRTKDQTQDVGVSLKPLTDVMQKLLAPGGCPWDREQTSLSLAPYAIEEAHELAEAIENGNAKHIKEELGDFMFQVIFHATLAERAGQFSLKDVIHGVTEKLIHRHPHVFGKTSVKNSDEVLKNWEQIKKEEKKNKIEKVFDIPIALPALQRAQKIGQKTKNMKFDWTDPSEVFAKVEEEVRELREAFDAQDAKATEEELGDVFFVLAQLARHLKLEAESVARKGNQKFEKRFEKILQLSKAKNLDFVSLSTEEKESLWEEVKKTATK